MTNEQILKKAIEKAVKGGWAEGKEMIEDDIDYNPIYYTSWDVFSTIIFSHDFAKAFWGNESRKKYHPEYWKEFLQQMVIEKEPLQYLERFL